MKKETYEAVFQRICSVKYGVRLMRLCNKGAEDGIAGCYMAAVLLSSLRARRTEAAVFLAVPAAGFFFITQLRKRIDAKRPYEVYGFTPLLEKETKGKSFPSRHVFSGFVIGSTIFWRYPYVGIFVCALSLCLALLRVAAGVHFPKDVFGGGIAGLLGGGIAGLLLWLAARW